MLQCDTMKFTYPPGSKPLNGYTIEHGVGVGGFGEVYYAISEAGKKVALKKIQRNLEIELRGVRQCLNLKHVNLIALWDIKTTPEQESWVVMEYVPGPSLRDIIEAHPHGMADDQIQRWFASIASGVAYLHQQGIVHRDLKPGNIFLDEESDVVKIGDYGLSKYIHPARRSGQTESIGTLHYMAPEIGRGVYGVEIDIYALGVILFEMLTGNLPFDGESTHEIIMKHMTDLPSLSRVPERFQAVIRCALEKDPELRYRNVSELVGDLPWPEIAASSAGIVRRNSVGSLHHRGPNDSIGSGATEIDYAVGNEIDTFIDGSHVTIVHEKTLAGNLAVSDQQPAVTPDIIFGEVYDSRHPANASAATNGASRPQRRTSNIQGRPTSATINTVAHSPVIAIGYDATATEQIVEMLRSLLIATMACFSLTLLGLAIGGANRDASFESWSVYLWLAFTCLFACVCLLVVGKIWETRLYRPASWRRLKLASMGLVIGLFAFFVAGGLEFNLSDASLYGFRAQSVSEDAASAIEASTEPEPIVANSKTEGISSTFKLFSPPILLAYLIFFTMLFGTLRWWRQFDRGRANRIELLPIVLAFLLAIVLSVVLNIPAALNAILVIVVSVAVQLAAPWNSTGSKFGDR